LRRRAAGRSYSPDGKTLAVGVGPENVYVNTPSEIVLWDAATHEKRLTLRGHVGDISALAFNGDGSLLASGGVNNIVKLWDIASQSASKHGR
jgi:WD40 repeat protein